MSLGRPKPPLQLDRGLREQLEAMAWSRSLPHGVVTHVRIVLLSADGLSNKGIAARVRLNQVTDVSSHCDTPTGIGVVCKAEELPPLRRL